MLISNMTILFSNSSPKIPKSGIFGPKFMYFCFFVKFRNLTNLRVLILNMTIAFLKILPKNTQMRHFCQKYPNKAFLIPYLGNFVSSQNFAITLIRRCWFQIWQWLFKIVAQKYPNKTFLVPNLDIFIISRYFATRQIQECWFQIWQ